MIPQYCTAHHDKRFDPISCEIDLFFHRLDITLFHTSYISTIYLSLKSFLFYVRLKLPQNVPWTDEIKHVISANTEMNRLTLAHHISFVTNLFYDGTYTRMNEVPLAHHIPWGTYLLYDNANTGMNGVTSAHHISFVTYLSCGSSRNRDW